MLEKYSVLLGETWSIFFLGGGGGMWDFWPRYACAEVPFSVALSSYRNGTGRSKLQSRRFEYRAPDPTCRRSYFTLKLDSSFFRNYPMEPFTSFRGVSSGLFHYRVPWALGCWQFFEFIVVFFFLVKKATRNFISSFDIILLLITAFIVNRAWDIYLRQVEQLQSTRLN